MPAQLLLSLPVLYHLHILAQNKPDQIENPWPHRQQNRAYPKINQNVILL